MIPLPDLSLHLAKTSTAVSGAGPLQTMFSVPISFDHSGWNVAAPGSTGNQSATGGAGAGNGAPGLLGGGLLAGINPNMIALGAVAYFLLKRN